jgi:hypothetical protein
MQETQLTSGTGLVQSDAGRLVGRGVAVNKESIVGAESRFVTSEGRSETAAGTVGIDNIDGAAGGSIIVNGLKIDTADDGVEAIETGHLVEAGSKLPAKDACRGVMVNMAVAVTFAEVQEAVVGKLQGLDVVGVNVSFIGFAEEELGNLAGRSYGVEMETRLGTVEGEDGEVSISGGEVKAGDVDIFGIVRGRDVAQASGDKVVEHDIDSRIGSAGNRVRDIPNGGIGGIAIPRHVVDGYVGEAGTEESKAIIVGRPCHNGGNAELLFVEPVGSGVKEGIGMGVVGDGQFKVELELADVDITVHHVGAMASVRREDGTVPHRAVKIGQGLHAVAADIVMVSGVTAGVPVNLLRFTEEDNVVCAWGDDIVVKIGERTFAGGSGIEKGVKRGAGEVTVTDDTPVLSEGIVLAVKSGSQIGFGDDSGFNREGARNGEEEE